MAFRAGLVRFAAIVLMLLAPALAHAAGVNGRYATIVMEAGTNRVLYATNPDELRHPASMTKMMTLLMLFEALERGEVAMDTKMRVSKHAATRPPTKLGLKARSTIAVEDAINALIILSANDAASVVAEHLGGTESKFGQMMTQRAHALGMTSTVFRNASGLPDPKQVSTARDMATLSLALINNFPQHYAAFSRGEFTFRGVTYRTHNRLLNAYEGADGLKTGFINSSGFNLAASAKRDGHRVVAVTFGGATAANRDRHVADLLDRGFALLTNQPETTVATARIYNYEQSYNRPVMVARAKTPRRGRPSETAIGDVNEPASTLASTVPAAAAGMWGIQVGAFGKRATAESQARAAELKLKPDYASAVAIVQTGKANGKTIYRARIVGLPKADLVRACSIAAPKAKNNCQAISPEAMQVAAR
ncbi:MAG: D-alanyl-D-alanine carboxypeptidase [Rhodospirillaceae bacterium]